MKKEKQEVLEAIGQFFLEAHDNDYQKTERFLRMMEITNLHILSSSKIMILLRRPGLLIGKKGQTIEGLHKHLQREIQIVEDTDESLYDFLIPRDWSDF